MARQEINLTEQVSGVLPVVNGGTGASSIPTWNQNTTGSAATLTTPRAINGVNFDGSGAVTLDTFAGSLFDARKTQRDTTLLASQDFVARDVLEIASTTSLEIPATSSLEVGVSSIVVGRGAFASRPGNGTTVGDLYECTDIGNEYRWNGSSWDMTRGGVLTAFTPPPTSGWSALNSGSVTTGLDSRVSTLASSAGDSWAGETRTLSPASNYTAVFYFDWALFGTNYSGGGIILRNSGSGSLVTFAASFDSAQGNWTLAAAKWTTATTFSAAYTTRATATLINGLPNWLRVRDDATTRFLEYSNNGVDWVAHSSVGRTDFITPDQIGWGINSNNSGGTYTNTARLRHFAGVS